MHRDSMVSVIVPVYNVEKWLKRCIDSICNQTYQNLEIILIDDGSTDNSGTICEQLREGDSRIKVIHKANGGLSDARNIGILNATGEYVSFIDSDDWIEKDFIENLFNIMVEHSCDVAGCAYRKCEDIHDAETIEMPYKVKAFERIDAMSQLINNAIQQVVWNKLYKKAIIKDIDFEVGKCHEDEFWSYRVFARLNRYVEIDYVGYNYFQRRDSIMGENYSLRRLDAVEAKVQRQRFLEKNISQLASQGKINLVFTCMYHGQMALRNLKKNERQKVFSYLKKIVKSCEMRSEDYKMLSSTHKVWMVMTKYSLKSVCCIRNSLNIGL